MEQAFDSIFAYAGLRAAWHGYMNGAVMIKHAIVVAAWLALGGAGEVCAALADGAVQFTTVDESNRIVPCRIHLRDSAGKAVKAPGLPFWHDHFVCTGRVSLALSPGAYVYEIERGPEYRAISNSFVVAAEATLSFTNQLRRIANMAAEGWWSGEFHVHRKLEEIELLMAAEDLHFAHVITWWNNSSQWREMELPSKAVATFDRNRFYHRWAGEDERGGGALLYLNLGQPMDITGSKREFPSSVKFLANARGVVDSWIDIEKPFWWDVPLWLANGPVHSIGIAHNHHHRGGMLDNEAWGKARDRARFGDKHGNGLWTQEIYFHALNCGFRLPPSAGSASGVLPNPVGYNRVYVHLGDEPSWGDWHDAFRLGRVFVSNGPLLRCRANGKLPGNLLFSTEPFEVAIDMQLDSREPIRSLELIHNGRVERVKLPGPVRIKESGWFLIRAIADLDHTFRFACTGPWYVDIATTRRPVQKRSAEFFLEWTRERRSRLQATDFEGRPEVLKTVQEAESYWKHKAGSATVE